MHKIIKQNQDVLLDTLSYPDIQPVVEILPWRTQWNYYEDSQEGEVNPLPSVTQQNQSLSLKTLLERHTSGRPIDDYIRPGGLYDFDINTEVGKEFFDTYQGGIPDTTSMDITEKQELAKQTETFIKAHKEQIVHNTAKKRFKAMQKKSPPPPEGGVINDPPKII